MSSVFTIIIYGETEMTSGQKKENKGTGMSTIDKNPEWRCKCLRKGVQFKRACVANQEEK